MMLKLRGIDMKSTWKAAVLALVLSSGMALAQGAPAQSAASSRS